MLSFINLWNLQIAEFNEGNPAAFLKRFVN